MDLKLSYNINIQKIADELEFDLEDVEMIMDSFLENAQTNLIYMKNAIKLNNLEEIKTSAHAIKGSSLNLLLNEIGNIAKELEFNAMKKNDIDYLLLYEKLHCLIKGLKGEE